MKGRAPYLAVVERKLSTTTSTLDGVDGQDRRAVRELARHIGDGAPVDVITIEDAITIKFGLVL